MDQFAQAIPLLVAAALGLIIGYEREIRLKPAGVRTHIIVCVGACMFALMSELLYPVNPIYMSAYVVTGIGFLGAGMILHEGKHGISGLTTAASIWTTAAIGVAIANSLYLIAFVGALITVIAPLIPHPHSVVEKHRE